MGIIYKITCNINGKSYIGQTINLLEERWNGHLKFSEKNDTKFSRAIRKYGKENWIKEILETTDNSLLNEREIYWIQYYDTYNNGYNATLGGYQIFDFSTEIRQKMSNAAKKRMLSEKKTGEYNRAFKRWYITPWGKFGSSIEAASFCPYAKMDRKMIVKYCIHNTEKIKKITSSDWITSDLIGKTYKELGYDSIGVR